MVFFLKGVTETFSDQVEVLAFMGLDEGRTTVGDV